MNYNGIKIVPEEEMLGEYERRFSGIINYIEKETRNDEERLTLLATYNNGIKSAISLLLETKNRIEYVKDPLSIYMLGVKESIYIIEDMIDKMVQKMKENEVEIEAGRNGISFIHIYMKGIRQAVGLHQRKVLNHEILKIVKDLDAILSDYEGKDPEEVWEKIRSRIGVSIKF